MILSTYFQMLQAVIVQDAVIDTFTGCAFAVYLPVFFGIPLDTGMEAEVIVILYVDSAPIVSGGTFLCMGAGIYAAAFQRAAVFVSILYGIIAPWAHFMPGRAEGMPGFIKGNVCFGIFRRLCPAVDVNECIDIPAFQQFIGWDVVMCGVKADIFRGQPEQMPSKVVNGVEKVFTVVASGTGKLHQKREFDFQAVVPAAEHVQGMPKKPCFIVTVPSPCGIRVRIMAAAAVPVWAGFAAGGKMPAVRGSMGNIGRAVTG